MNARVLAATFEVVLKMFGYYAKELVDLLLLIASVESELGRFTRQLGGGPALGLFQIEPNTANSVYDDYLKFRTELMVRVDAYRVEGSLEYNLEYNILFQIVFARIMLRRIKELIPVAHNYPNDIAYVTALAAYWKKYWNTPNGKGKVEHAVNNYYALVRREL